MKNKFLALITVVIMTLGMLSGCSFLKPAIEDIVFTENEYSVAVGESFEIEYKIYPSSQSEASLTWQSSNEKIATVENGRVTGVSVGTASIIASSKNGVVGSCIVNVSSTNHGNDNDDNENGGENTPDTPDNPPAAVESGYSLGMGVVVNLDSSRTGTAQVDATVAVVVLDKDGKIVSCRIDAVQNAAALMDGAFTFTKLEKTKKEFGYDYNMSKYGIDNNGDGIVKEWFEQAKLFEEYVVGMTVEEVKNIGTQFVNNHYIASDDALLTAGCTIQITGFIDAIEKACEDDQAVSFKTDKAFTLGVAANSFDDASTAAGYADGVIRMYTDFGAAVVVDGVVVAALNDAIQPQIKFNEFDEITSTTFNGTKRELKEDYNMAKYGHSTIGNATVAEWYLQSAAFSAYVVGKTASEIKNIPTQVVEGSGSIIADDDALLSAGCTIQITSLKDIVAKAAENAN